MTGQEAKPGRRAQGIAVATSAVVIVGLFLFADSERTLSNRVFNADGYVNMDETAPVWIRERFGDGAAAWFDTITEVGLTKEIPVGVPYRAARIDSLNVLVLAGSEATDADIEPFRDHANLSVVLLSGTAVTDDVFAVLETLPKLSRVSLTSTDVTADGIAAFRKARPSVDLEVDSTTEAGLGRFSRWHKVSYSGPPDAVLSFDGTVPPEFFPAAAALDFEQLDLTDVRFNEDVLKLITDRPLRKLTLRRTELTDEGATACQSCPLQVVQIADAVLTAPAARKLARIDLERLSLNNVALEAGAAQALAEIQAAELSLSRMRFTAADRLAGLRVDRLYLFDVEWETADTFAHVQADDLIGQLLPLDLATARRLATIPSESLTLVQMRGDRGAVLGLDASVARRVSLYGGRISKTALAAIVDSPVEVLDLQGVWLEEQAETALAGSSVRSLRVPDWNESLARGLTDSAVRDLAIGRAFTSATLRDAVGDLSRLERLDLRVVGLTEEDFAQLMSLPRLRKLNIDLFQPFGVSPSALAQVAEQRPDLQIRVRCLRGFGYRGNAMEDDTAEDGADWYEWHWPQ